MLTVKTEMMIDKMNEVMDLFKSRVTLNDITDMSADDLELLKKSMELYDLSCRMCLEQARVIDKLDKTTNELLEINKKLLLKAEGLA